MKRSFASLSPQEALGMAVSIEERNADIYRRFAEMFTEFGDEESLEIAAIFWEMATEERGHQTLLQEKYTQQYGNANCPLSEEHLVEFIEVPKLDDGDVFEEGNDAPVRERALQVALQAEVSAQQFYAKLVEQTPEGPLRQLYGDLAEMEDGHVAYLEARLAQDRAANHAVQ